MGGKSPGALRPVSLAHMAKFEANERPCLKKNMVERTWRQIPKVVLWSLHIHVHTQVGKTTHMNVYMLHAPTPTPTHTCTY